MVESVEVKRAPWGAEVKTQRDIDLAYDTGADFVDFSGRAVNRQDAKNLGLRLLVRYGKNYTKVYVPKNNYKDVK